ncbi:type 1 glutamine amidotransferase domain-containing protein [Chitinophaga horti]|uniref:Type 1 glutamine amidotransferase domain-containing protein n=1 Tax=Chitinophaga horti TaxID=2920382 RepID=A0ABY6J516_9BACT|nr:type 1 glutamine amidotransferase domain-containing protein [Chitinophaga horti]UYQ93389.1 type 1 glutamine amidotransferase domain-containing protein [Chitinophaga horti]
MTFLFALLGLLAPNADAPVKAKKVLFVVTSFGEVKGAGKTGLWLEEFSTPYYLLTEKGVEITIASPKGGPSPIDPKSTGESFLTPSAKKFLADPAAQQRLNTTIPLSDINPADYDAIFYPGGHGPMWDLTDHAKSIALISGFYEQGKPVALVCHAPAVLKNVKLKSGEYLVKGKTVAGFTNSEEKTGGSLAMTPFSLEDMLKERGAKYERGADWGPFAVEDGNLVTGQNPASAEVVAGKLLAALGVK